MYSDRLEKAFDGFLNRPEYDEAEGALFDIVRAAFRAGWKAASGEAMPPQNVVRLLRKPETNEDV